MPPIARFQNPNPERDRSFLRFTRSALPFLARPLDGRLTRFFLPSIKVSIPLTHILFSLSLCINYISLLRCATSARKQDPPPPLSPSPSMFHPRPTFTLELSSSPTWDYTTSHLDFPGKEPQKEADAMCPIRLGSQSALNSLTCHNARYRNTLLVKGILSCGGS